MTATARSKFADAMRQFQEFNLNPKYPHFCRGYRNTRNSRKLQKEYVRTHSFLMEKNNQGHQ